MTLVCCCNINYLNGFCGEHRGTNARHYHHQSNIIINITADAAITDTHAELSSGPGNEGRSSSYPQANNRSATRAKTSDKKAIQQASMTKETRRRRSLETQSDAKGR